MQIDIVTTSDGVRIATATHGAGPPLVFARGWSSHLEHLWSDPLYRAYFEALGERFTVVRFDMRGNGLSDREMPSLDLAAMVADIEAVMNALGGRPVVLYGQCFGGPAAIAYAVAHPERVERLILDGTYADGRRIVSPERRKRILTTLRDLPQAGMAFMTHMTHPNPPPTMLRTATLRGDHFYENALALYTFGYGVDVTALLGRIAVPTLVLHRMDTRAIPFRLGKELAAQVPGATFVPLEGQAHNPWDEYPEDALAAIGEFLGVELRLPADRDECEGAPRTILHVEIAPADEDAGSEVRALLREQRGTELAPAGGGNIAASFTSPSRAVECAMTIARSVAGRDGANHARVLIVVDTAGEASEPGVMDGELLARARSSASGNGGDIVVTNSVRERCAGKGFLFAPWPSVGAESGEAARLFEVRWREGA